MAKPLAERHLRTFRALIPSLLGVEDDGDPALDGAVARLDAYVRSIPEEDASADLRLLFDAVLAAFVAQHLRLPWKVSRATRDAYVERFFSRRRTVFEKALDFVQLERSTGMSARDIGKSLREMAGLAYYSHPATYGFTTWRGPWARSEIWSRPDVVRSGAQPPKAPPPVPDVVELRRFHAEGHPYTVDRLYPPGRAGIAGPRVLVIGSGAGGAAAAWWLAAAGCRVAVLEAGPRLMPHDYPTDTLAGMSLLFERGLLTVSKDLDLHLLRGRVVGGSTVMTSGLMIPIRDETRRRWQTDHGVDAAGLAEMLENVRRRTRMQPLRDDQTPVPSLEFRDGLRAAGYVVDEELFYVASSPGTHPPASGGLHDRAGDHCLACGMCNYGCRYGHKYGADVAYLLAAERAFPHNVRVHPNLPVSHVEAEQTAGGLRVTAVHTEARAGTPSLRVPCDELVLACGATGTPALLLRSAERGALERLPGVRDRSIGTNLGFNYGTPVVARFDERARAEHARRARGPTRLPLADREAPPWGPEGFQVRYVGREAAPDRQWYVMEHAFVPPGLVSNVVPGVGAEHRRWMRAYRHLGMGVNTMAYERPLEAAIAEFRARHGRDPDLRRDRLVRTHGRVDARKRVHYAIDERHEEFGMLLDSLSHVLRAYLHADHVIEVGLGGVRDETDAPVFRAEAWRGASAERIRAELARTITNADMLMLSAGHPQGGMSIQHDAGPVTTDFRLRGTTNAWVTDASVFPGPIVVNPAMTVFAVGELAGRTMCRALARRHPQLEPDAGAAVD